MNAVSIIKYIILFLSYKYLISPIHFDSCNLKCISLPYL